MGKEQDGTEGETEKGDEIRGEEVMEGEESTGRVEYEKIYAAKRSKISERSTEE